MTSVTTQKQEQVDYGKLWWLTLLAGAVSAVANLAIYYLAQALGFVGELVPSFGDAPPPPIPFAGAIVGATFSFIIIGGIALWVIDRFSAKPISTWRIVAIVALLLSFSNPFFAFSNTNEIILLLVMHTVSAIITIYIISTQAKKA